MKQLLRNERKSEMYTYVQLTEEEANERDTMGYFEVLDPEGDHICFVETKGEAESLLSHLNR